MFEKNTRTCHLCAGSGSVWISCWSPRVRCPACDGDGKLTTPRPSPPSPPKKPDPPAIVVIREGQTVAPAPAPAIDGEKQENQMSADMVNEPPHYKGVRGVECIEAIEAMGCGVEFCRANAVKYLWRLGKKGEALEDAKKCSWYVQRLIKQLESV